LQEKQLGIVRNILDENKRSSDSLGEAKSIEDLMAMQSRLAGAQLERVAEFWSSVWHAAAESQKTWIEQLQSQIGQAKDRVRETATGSVREAASGAQPHQRKTA
ncbi:MAG TPA: phasin family protein, partial [Burkholderiales bacterium]|nr:phasin family protein [Burkholderiales bacterium]